MTSPQDSQHDRRIDYIEMAATTIADTVLVVIFATDPSAMEQRVRKSGGKIVKPIFSFPGGRRFHFADPSGNELAVWSDR